jgi:hypothetical protein
MIPVRCTQRRTILLGCSGYKDSGELGSFEGLKT